MRGILKKEDSRFPEMLHRFAPSLEFIYCDGDLSLLKERAVAAVGSRRCTQYGKTVAKSIGKKAAGCGVVLVSGLAKGIDTWAHTGALEAVGKTIAVLGGGTDYYYPAENKDLQQKIAREGLLLSLHPPTYQPRPYDFPIRNQIISALSESVAVVEAGGRSGALITAEYAAEQGKNVYAVPGNITSHYSFGTNKLIRDGAAPLIFIDDLFLDLNLCPEPEEDLYQQMSENERKVFKVVKNGGEVTIEEIYHKTNIKLSEINAIITILELKGIIFSSLGKIFVAKF